MDSANIVARVKNILLSPKTEWPVAAAEPASVRGLYAGYVAIVAALPVIAHFIKSSLIGTSFLGITVHVSIGAGIGRMVLSYILSLVLVYVMAWIVNALARPFGGQGIDDPCHHVDEHQRKDVAQHHPADAGADRDMHGDAEEAGADQAALDEMGNHRQCGHDGDIAGVQAPHRRRFGGSNRPFGLG